MRTEPAKRRRPAAAVIHESDGGALGPAVIRPVRSAAPVVAPEPGGGTELHFGTLLRRARERRGLSQQDVIRVTRISERWLPALEEGRLDLLPAPVFVSGYVRSYARVVGLDEGDLVDRYHALVQQRAAQAEPTLPPGPARRPLPPPLFIAGCLAALAALVLLAWLLLHRT